jgi:hypothetical protein
MIINAVVAYFDKPLRCNTFIVPAHSDLATLMTNCNNIATTAEVHI